MDKFSNYICPPSRYVSALTAAELRRVPLVAIPEWRVVDPSVATVRSVGAKTAKCFVFLKSGDGCPKSRTVREETVTEEVTVSVLEGDKPNPRRGRDTEATLRESRRRGAGGDEFVDTAAPATANILTPTALEPPDIHRPKQH